MTENPLTPEVVAARRSQAFVGARVRVELMGGTEERATVTEVLDGDAGIRVSYDDASVGTLELDDAWFVLSGVRDGDALPAGFRQVFATHPLGCPRCWAAARRAAMEAQARGEDFGSVEAPESGPDGRCHAASVRSGGLL